jgi:N-acetylglutamate synthase-like GNAT family acetyltransferase
VACSCLRISDTRDVTVTRDIAEASSEAAARTVFSEKDFYLGEFRGRAIAIALEGVDSSGLGRLPEVLAELAANATRVILLAADRVLLEKLVADAVVAIEPGPDAIDPRWVGALWRRLREGSTAGLLLPASEPFAAGCRAVAHSLQLAKLVWIDPDGGLQRSDGTRASYVDLAELEAMMASGVGDAQAPSRIALLREFHAMVAGGVPAVNVCSLAGLSEELFSYAGSGTLFTRQRYTAVRRLSLDEFDAANHLIHRGVQEKYLAPRTPEEVDWVLAHAFGVFIEGRYLAGIGALLPTAAGRAAEVASLYTLTRFVKEGVGAHLVAFAMDWAAEMGVEYVFACTTSDRVVGFFERHGFVRAEADQVPPEKWLDYPEERRGALQCLRRDVSR